MVGYVIREGIAGDHLVARDAYRLEAVHGEVEHAEFAAARRVALRARGFAAADDRLDAMRRRGTVLALRFGGAIVGGISCWRLSEAGCSLPHLLAGGAVGSCSDDRVVEVGSLFVSPEHAGRGLSHRLLQAQGLALATIDAALVIAFAVTSEAGRFARQWGFRRAGVEAPHPNSPAIRVVPMVARAPEVVAKAVATAPGAVSFGERP